MTPNVRSIRTSILTTQALRSLRVCARARQLHRADIQTGVVEPRGWSAISIVARAEYRLRAEAEVAPPPQMPRRDETVGRDQVTRGDRGRVLRFGGPHV